MSKKNLARRLRHAGAAVAAAALGGCATLQLGHPFDLNTFDTQVQRGTTTAAQIRQWLGPPVSTGIDVDTSGQRYQQWTYYYGSGKLNHMDQAAFKILQIKFDQQGVVEGYNYSSPAK